MPHWQRACEFAAEAWGRVDCWLGESGTCVFMYTRDAFVFCILLTTVVIVLL